jgi:hypothetical protein
MRAVDFLENQKQDIETHQYKIILSEVISVMSEVLKNTPDVEMEPTKTAEDCYKQMYEYAKKNKSDNAYVFTPTGTFRFVREYLGLPEPCESQDVVSTVTDKKRRNLEDFF